MVKFSIISPVYNVGNYLKEYIDSVLKQTFVDFELILIDDASNDDSLKICEQFVCNDYRCKLIKLSENKGPSCARNMGIKESKGEYILFFDPDDSIESNTLEIINQNIVSNDILFYSYKKVYCRKKQNVIAKYNYSFGFVNEIIANSTISGYLWNKCFKSKIIKENNITFNEKIHVMEDTLFVIEYLQYVQHSICIKNILYNYRQRTGSLVNSNNINKVTSLYSLEKIYKYCESEKEKKNLKILYTKFFYKYKKQICTTGIYIDKELFIDKENRYLLIFLYKHFPILIVVIRRILIKVNGYYK